MSDNYNAVDLDYHQAIRLMALDRALQAKTAAIEPNHKGTLELAESYTQFITDGTTP
jgi:hypothetical protein